jgi:hypothetical protein
VRTNYSYNLKWLQHDRTRKSDLGERKPVTVCIAALFHWNYASPGTPNQFDSAALVLTDRTITAGDVKYEPAQRKIAHISPTTLILVAGDYGYHSTAIKETFRQTDETASPEKIATIYAQAIQALKRREAEDLYLAPLGLNTDSFIAQQNEMSSSFVATLREQMQNHRSEEVAALVVGSQSVRGIRTVRIFEVSTLGIVTCHDDVGFAAIGIGAWHAKANLMQAGYVNTLFFPAALGLSYAAKKASEVAPGVGDNTDVSIVFKDRVEPLRQDLADALPELYKSYAERRQKLSLDALFELRDFIAKLPRIGSDDKKTANAGSNATPDGGANPPATETPRANETEKQAPWEAFWPKQKT